MSRLPTIASIAVNDQWVVFTRKQNGLEGLMGSHSCRFLLVRTAPEGQRAPFSLCLKDLEVALTSRTNSNITGTSTSTPTTVTRAAPDSIPNTDIAAATAELKEIGSSYQGRWGSDIVI
jgi:hypothetical protein